MPPATMSSGADAAEGLLLVFQEICKISPGAPGNFHLQKPRVCPHMILTFGFLAGPAKIHPKAFVSFRWHCGCLGEEF